MQEFIKSLEQYNIPLPTLKDIHSVSADEFPTDFAAAMNEDIAVPQALASLFSHIHQANTYLHSDLSSDSIRHKLEHLTLLIFAMLDVFGLDPLDEVWGSPRSTEEKACFDSVLERVIKAQLLARQKARDEKDFTTADSIRDSLAQAGIIIKDTPQGMIWSINNNGSI